MEAYEYAFVGLNDRLYDEDIRMQLAGLFDIAVNTLGISGQRTADLFVASGLAEEFERQNPRYIVGKSPAELAYLLVKANGAPISASDIMQATVNPLSLDYWTGYMLAYFQLNSGWLYNRIFERMGYADLREMYHWCKDLSEEEYAQEVRRELTTHARPSRLQTFRKNLGFTQSELAAKVGVSARAIQQYEQSAKNINKAAAETVFRLSRVLHVGMEDLLEF